MSIDIFLKGVSLGFTAGISPGPLTVLVISQTLRFGLKEGSKVALAPVITDIPVIAISYGIMTYFSKYKLVIPTISILGSFFLLKMALNFWNSTGIDLTSNQANPKSLKNGIITNLLMPQPYLFWMTIGIPIMMGSKNISMLAPINFVVGFLLLLVFTKILIAFFVMRSADFLDKSIYKFLLKTSSLVLFLFSIHLFYSTFKALG